MTTEHPPETPLFDPGPLGRIVLMVLLTGAVVLHVSELASRGLDPDELEHLHASYLVSLGDVPYRDFFEHHGPALYYAVQPLFRMLGPEISVLLFGRICAGLCSLMTLMLTGLLARRIAGRGTLVPAMALLAWGTVFHLKGIEFRPDVPATTLLLMAALFWKPQASSRRVLLAGFCAGLATLFTQKSIVPAAGLWLGQMLLTWMTPTPSASEVSHRPDRSRLADQFRSTWLFALGAGLPWIAAFSLFALRGAADDLWRGAVWQLWAWPLRSNRLEILKSVSMADLGLFAAALCEMWVCIWKLVRGRDKSEQNLKLCALAVAVAWCLFSLVWIKAAYAQFYLLWQPLVVVLAVRRLTAWCQFRDDWRFVLSIGVAAVVLAVVQLLAWKQAFLRAESGALPWLTPWLDQLDAGMMWCLLLLLASVLFAASQGQRSKAILLLMVVAQFYGLLRIANAVVWPNQTQRDVIAFVQDQVLPEGRILDGFTGFAPLRRHALYYWWINDYSLALMQHFGDEQRLLEELQRNPPDAVLFDDELRKLPPDVIQWLEANYFASDIAPLWLPRKPNSRAATAP